ncbi:hypothetical protein ACFRCQ_07545 [Cytobacillus firmus]|uniref:hypothetical protein n=1 Tax=Cytobacillus firmus TaxID=1399 RepID=UPI0036A21960
MRRLFDVTEKLTNGYEMEIHENRGKTWDADLKEEDEARKRQARSMLWERINEGRERNTVFKIAEVCKLPVLVVREVEADFLRGET